MHGWLCLVTVVCVGLITRQRSPTECGVSECDREASILRRLWPTRVYCAIKKFRKDATIRGVVEK